MILDRIKTLLAPKVSPEVKVSGFSSIGTVRHGLKNH